MNFKNISKFYNSRFYKYGDSINSVGWGSIEDQFLRFEILFRGFDLNNRSFLDVGCGLGGFVEYLEYKGVKGFNYLGIDISENLLGFAEKKYRKVNNVEFKLGEILEMDFLNKKFDYVFASGTFSYNSFNIEEYAINSMKKMFMTSDIACSVNFLSSYSDFQLKKNKHYSPEIIFSKSKEITKKINLIHDYQLYEFTIQLIK